MASSLKSLANKVKKGNPFMFLVYFFLIFLNHFTTLGEMLFAEESIPQRKTYILAVGINNYPQPYGKLNYAAEDAAMFAEVMQSKGISTFNKEKEEYVFLNNPEVVLLSDIKTKGIFPTKDNILKELDSILENSKEDDFVIVFFSGHGTGESLVTVTEESITETIELKDIISRLDFKTKEYMLFLDACRNSSNSTIPFSTSLEPGEGGFKSIFYSTGKDSLSQESKKLGQGVYSHYLVEGLYGAADSNKDYIVTSDEIRNYVSEKVIAFTDNKQKPQLHQISSATKFLTSVEKPTPLRYIWKSALLPGLGQWEKKQTVNSIFFFSSALLGSIFLYSKNLEYEQLEREYYSRQTMLLLSSPSVLDATDLILFQSTQSIRKDLISESRSFESSLDVFLLLYLWNLWDAGFNRYEWFHSDRQSVKIEAGNYNNSTLVNEQRFRITSEWRF